MKKNLKNNVYLCLTLLFLFLIFKNNTLFQNCIINACLIFFKNVFPTLFPMMIINDLLINFNFIYYLNKIFGKLFKKIFSMSNAASYAFLMSIISGTPTNAYIINNLIKQKNLPIKDASIIISYSFFLNPLFLMNTLSLILNDKILSLKLIFLCYSINFLIILFFRNYDYQDIDDCIKNNSNFTKILQESISNALKNNINILGTIIFYMVISSGLNLFIKNELISCLINGFLEVSGGLIKLSTLNISFKLKEIIAVAFISFGGLSIKSQIKNALDAKVNLKYFTFARLSQVLLVTTITIITS